MDLGRHWKPAATALVLATFLAGRQIASWGTARNRWDYFWQRQDAVALIVTVLILSVMVYAIGMILSRWGWSRKRRLHELGLVLGLIAALLSQFPALNKDPSITRATLLWLGVAALTWLAWRKWPDRLARFARAVCLVMLPLVPILFAQMLMWKPWDVREFSTPGGPEGEQSKGHPFVVMVIFDEWSWSRLAPRGEVRTDFPNLRKLAEMSVVVRDARSAGWATRYAIPRLVFQANGEVVPGNGSASWKDSSGQRPSVEVPSLFDSLHDHNYRSSVIGFYINYRGLLGADAPNRVWSLPYAPKRTSWSSEIWLMLMGNLQHWTDPISQSLWPPLSSRVYSQSWVYLLGTMKQSAMHALATEPANTFLLIHLPLPHAPFIFDERGNFRGQYQGERMSDDTSGYQRHLRYADRVLGEIMDTLDRAGRLDNSLLVVTSDHSWRKEPDSALLKMPDAGLRVPLLIKWPGQKQAIVSDQSFCALGLWPVLEAAIAPPAPPAMTDSLWQAISASGRGKTCVR